jgi:hypothetical protein
MFASPGKPYLGFLHNMRFSLAEPGRKPSLRRERNFDSTSKEAAMRGFITAGAFAIVLMTTGLAAQAGGGDSNLYVNGTMQQVRSNDYSIQFDQNGHGTRALNR